MSNRCVYPGHRIEPSIPELDALLDCWKDELGDAYHAYKNHVYRLLHFCFSLSPPSAEERRKLIIAAVFHDLGLWTEQTVDYLPPSVELARRYLEEEGLQDWCEEIGLMIDMHHKLTAYPDMRYPLVELFRQADRVDFSLGWIRHGLDAGYIQQVQQVFPNAGFHKYLLKVGSLWVLRHPLNPAPIFKW